MSITMGEFSDEMNTLGKTFPGTANQAIRLFALQVLSNIILATPIDIGRARSNWFVGIDSPIDEETDDTDWKQNKLTQEAKLLHPTAGSEIWLTNNLPYIVRLNEGWSGQAPEGFVESAVKAAERSIGNIANTIFVKGF